MNKYNLLFLLITPLLIISCNNNPKTKNDIPKDSTISEINPKQVDKPVIPKNNSSYSSIVNGNTPSFLKETEDYIKQYPGEQKKEFKRYMDELIKEWKDVPNPITATYKGNDFGDYHHIMFKDANGVQYDFGQAKNEYGQYKLHELSGDYNDNPKYLGKKFKVYWDWKLAKFLCCDGEYGKAEAYLPTITKLELIQN